MLQRIRAKSEFSNWVDMRLTEIWEHIERRSELRSIGAEELRRASNTGRAAAIAQRTVLGRKLLPQLEMRTENPDLIKAYVAGYDAGEREVVVRYEELKIRQRSIGVCDPVAVHRLGDVWWAGPSLLWESGPTESVVRV